MSFLAEFFAPELRAWRGAMPLWKVYWVYGVLASAALFALFFEAMREDRLILQQMILLLLALYTAWILIAAWRCAAHAPQMWSFFARLSIVAWAGNATLLLSFLELDLANRILS